MNIRAATDTDVASLVALFSESVHQIAARSYTPEQLAAWAPESPDLQQWRSRLACVETLVADFGGVIGGFISYTSSGHIEFLYTSPAFSRQGVASRLYVAATRRLHAKRVTSFSTDASLEACPFFEAMGFKVVEEQLIERSGVQLKRFAMTRISAEADA